MSLTSPLRQSQSSLSQADRTGHYEHHGGSVPSRALRSEDDLEYRQRNNKEMTVKMNELYAELSRMKAVVGHLEAERTSQDVWLKERYGISNLLEEFFQRSLILLYYNIGHSNIQD